MRSEEPCEAYIEQLEKRAGLVERDHRSHLFLALRPLPSPQRGCWREQCLCFGPMSHLAHAQVEMARVPLFLYPLSKEYRRLHLPLALLELLRDHRNLVVKASKEVGVVKLQDPAQARERSAQACGISLSESGVGDGLEEGDEVVNVNERPCGRRGKVRIRREETEQKMYRCSRISLQDRLVPS